MSNWYWSSTRMPPRLHLTALVAWFTAAHVFGWPGWAYGALGVLFGVLVLADLIRFFSHTDRKE